MTRVANIAYQGDKASRIIMNLSEMFGLPISDATDLYYESETAAMIENGTSDLHCRSDRYLATIVWEEFDRGGTGN